MGSPLTRYLTEFRFDNAGNAEVVHQPRPPRAQPQSPVDERLDMARLMEERIRREAKAEADRELSAALSAERARHQEELAAERTRWTQEQADRLAAQFGEAFEGLERQVLDSVGRVLIPFLSEALRSQVLEELSGTLSILLADRENRTVQVSGPMNLLSELEARMGARAATITFVPADAADVSIVSDGTVIETQLKAWISRMAEAVQSS